MLEHWIKIQSHKGNKAGERMGRTLLDLYGDVPYENQEKESQNPAEVSLITRITDALKFETYRVGHGPRITQITDHFNRTLGSKLDDQVLIKDLKLPFVGKSEKVRSDDLSAEEFSRVLDINIIVKSQYTRALNAITHSGRIETVGDLRRTEYDELIVLRNAGKVTADFLSDAFRRRV